MNLKIKFEIVDGKVVMEEPAFMEVLCELATLEHLRNLGVNNWRNYENPGLFPEDFENIDELLKAIERL